jgi:GH25 family lysozyme M1 (1,4-beta-N-acetylmuramidase)
MTPKEAELEADVFLSVIKGKQFEMPVYFDLEEKKQFDLGKEKVSAIMRAFLKKVESAGYFVGLYGSASSLTTHTADDIKSWYTIWLAHWVDQTNYSGAYGVWKHSEKGKVAGINGNVDLDICYKDFPTIIKGKGLNGYGKEKALTNPPAPVSDDGISVEIIVDGKKYSGKPNKA